MNRFFECLFFCFLICISVIKSFAQTNTYAPGHVYLYSEVKNNKKIFGLCTQEKIKMTDSKYAEIKQHHLFLVAQHTPLPTTGEGVKIFDVYNAWGKLLATATSVIPVDDSNIIINPYFNPDSSGNLKVDEAKRSIQIKSTGAQEIKPFQLTRPMKLDGYYEINKEGKKGVYNVVADKIILPPLYDTVMHKADSFFLGWSDLAHYKLVNTLGEQYESPQIVYHAKNINYNATIFGVDLFNGYSAAYNNHNKLIDSFTQFKNWMTFVIACKNPEIERKIKITKVEEFDPKKQVRQYLLDENGVPLLDPADNKDSLVEFAYGYLYLIKQYKKNQTSYIKIPYAIYNGKTKQMIGRSSADITIKKSQEGFLIREKKRELDFLDATGNVLARCTKVQPSESLQSLEKPLTLVTDRKIFRNNDEKFSIPSDDGKDYQVDQFVKLSNHLNDDLIGLRNYYSVKVNNKWGIYKVEDVSPARSERYQNSRKKITVIAEPKYNSVFVSKNSDQFQFQLKSQNGNFWIDSSGLVLAGGKDFPYINLSSLPNGHRLAYEFKYSNNFPFTTKLFLIDSFGKILKSISIKESNDIKIGGAHIINDNEIIVDNTIYNLNNGENINVLTKMGDYKIYEVNGRAVLIRGGKASFTAERIFKLDTKANYGTYKCLALALLNRELIPDKCGINPDFFFHDARGNEQFIINENGEFYQ